jgi:uncharacterized membrane protein YoaK (UPF0700 family)
MRAAIAQWLDKHADPSWRQMLHLHSTQAIFISGAFWSIVAGIWISLPAFIDWVPAPVFMGIATAFSFSIFIARFTKQPGLPDV